MNAFAEYRFRRPNCVARRLSAERDGCLPESVRPPRIQRSVSAVREQSHPRLYGTWPATAAIRRQLPYNCGTGDGTGRTDAVVTETSAPAPQPPSQPAPAPVATPPPRAEIVTSRQVWIRVTVDGQKVMERELPPDTRIPLNPAAQFVVRAGDAGAVKVTIDGKDQGPFGVDGRAATKAFAVPPKARE